MILGRTSGAIELRSRSRVPVARAVVDDDDLLVLFGAARTRSTDSWMVWPRYSRDDDGELHTDRED